MEAEFGDERLPERFWSKVEVRGDCWIWVANSTPKYGRFWIGKRGVLAHRHSYTVLVGEIPAGLQIDHLCRVKLCVRPAHLEPVTQSENLKRGFSARPPCEHGLPKHCHECKKKYKREWAAMKRKTDPDFVRREREADRRSYHKRKSERRS